MKPINKENPKGKFVEFKDKDGKQRVGKVTKIMGNRLTVKNCLGVKKRIHLDNVLGRVIRKKYIQKIES
ncbi:unnamed protein product [marine sediment metagenome]|uniref:Uncharacterized protein n=1 Tax=marine sediment metagenome TaxID=412755 RepID=X0U8I9_9ZZZZ